MLRSLRAARYDGVGRDEIALGDDVRADEPGDTRPEQWRDEARAAALVVAMVRGVGDVGDVVDEAGDRELGVVGVLGAEQRARIGARARARRASGSSNARSPSCEQRSRSSTLVGTVVTGAAPRSAR